MAQEADVVVIGAGFAGLTAARALLEAGASVRVLEAASRVGGRALTETSAANSAVDLGGQWVGSQHSELRALVADMGIDLFPSYDVGKQTVLVGGRPIPLVSMTGAGVAVGLTRLALAVRSGVGVRDDRRLSDWLATVKPKQARRLLDVALTELTCRHADDVSISAVADMFAGSGGIREMLTVRGGAQDSLIVGGAGALAEAMADELGDRIALNERVTEIEQSTAGVTVGTAGGAMRASRVIIAVAPPATTRIVYRPALPGAHTELQHSLRMGSVYKAVAVYPRPFWRDHGCDGQALMLDGPIRSAFDVSPPDGPGHLCVLVPGPAAVGLDALSADARRVAVLRAVADHFGPGVASPLSFHEKSWQHDQFAEGGYMGLPTLRQLAAVRAERARPTGRIHWAGTETADRFNGYFEGAIRSGRRAAGEALAAL
ncbi:flavin monoamine oxidase family protein [Gordonia crocea]|uniref:flavin monoamine oxidase family protein n=1 Tax=Gordonia crocea TaxID=589162 RepID=UPI0013796AA5|nr:NAD(P)/FAD-dependent oxidoreductase [Gordonia crocea]